MPMEIDGTFYVVTRDEISPSEFARFGGRTYLHTVRRAGEIVGMILSPAADKRGEIGEYEYLPQREPVTESRGILEKITDRWRNPRPEPDRPASRDEILFLLQAIEAEIEESTERVVRWTHPSGTHTARVDFSGPPHRVTVEGARGILVEGDAMATFYRWGELGTVYIQTKDPNGYRLLAWPHTSY
jgi:hypothetical protein